MPEQQTTYGRIMSCLARLEEWVIALLLAAMTVVTFVQVVLRYAFNSGFIWALELTSFLFAWLILFGMGYLVKVGGHIAVDVVTRLLPDRLRRAAALFTCVLAIGYAVLLIKGGVDLMTVYSALNIDAEDLPIPMWLVLSILPIGGALVLYRTVEAAVHIFKGERTGLSIPVDESAGTLEAHHQIGEDGRP